MCSLTGYSRRASSSPRLIREEGLRSLCVDFRNFFHCNAAREIMVWNESARKREKIFLMIASKYRLENEKNARYNKNSSDRRHKSFFCIFVLSLIFPTVAMKIIGIRSRYYLFFFFWHFNVIFRVLLSFQIYSLSLSCNAQINREIELLCFINARFFPGSLTVHNNYRKTTSLYFLVDMYLKYIITYWKHFFFFWYRTIGVRFETSVLLLLFNYTLFTYEIVSSVCKFKLVPLTTVYIWKKKNNNVNSNVCIQIL